MHVASQNNHGWLPWQRKHVTSRKLSNIVVSFRDTIGILCVLWLWKRQWITNKAKVADVYTSNPDQTPQKALLGRTCPSKQWRPRSDATERSIGTDMPEQTMEIQIRRRRTKYRDRYARTNNGDPDQTPQNAASDQGLHCLPFIQQISIASSDSKHEQF